MKKYKWIIILVNFIILMIAFNFAVLKKETTLKEGQLILLELAPKDPRSLMQGDYMRLNYAITRNIHNDSLSKRGFCVIVLDSVGVGRSIRFQNNKTPKQDHEFLIRYTAPSKRNINIGAESFFFEEGQANKFANAKYGGLKIDKEGHSILVGLWNEARERIEDGR